MLICRGRKIVENRNDIVERPTIHDVTVSVKGPWPNHIGLQPSPPVWPRLTFNTVLQVRRKESARGKCLDHTSIDLLTRSWSSHQWTAWKLSRTSRAVDLPAYHPVNIVMIV